jgi:hypothetical protein
MSFISLIENQEERSTSQCQDCRFVGYLFLLGSFYVFSVQADVLILIDFAVNYHSVSRGTSVSTWPWLNTL